MFHLRKKLIFYSIIFSISDSKSSGLIDCWEICDYRQLFKINLNDLVSTQAVIQVYDTSNLNQLQSTFYFFSFRQYISFDLIVL